jgi:hypothetical protein
MLKGGVTPARYFILMKLTPHRKLERNNNICAVNLDIILTLHRLKICVQGQFNRKWIKNKHV